jgi:O-succinylbenzoic acid--CoA ligase
VDRPLLDLPVDSPDLTDALAAALDGSGPALRPLPRGTRLPDEPVSRRVPAGVAVVVRTSGSTGAPRDVLLSAGALRASGLATARRLGGPGHWLLVLPPEHVAGLQVLARAALAGTPAHLGPVERFRPDGFAAAAAALPDDARRYTSVVPTQLVRLLDDEAGRAALRRFDAVLLGGAAIPAALLARARAAGVAVVTTYGMTETCGGCVYDGRALDGVRVRLDDGGRVLLAGPVLADGYLDRPDLDAAAFLADDEGTRWLRTSDVGALDAGGRLTVLGRADDVIVTGGVNVAPGPVEELLHALPGVREACVVGVDDDEWGQAVVAVLVAAPGGPPPLADVRALVTERLGAAAAPRRLVVVPALPTRGPGKPDRRAAAALAAAAARP